MKARLVPMYFATARDHEFDDQLERLKTLLAEEAEILEPVALGSPIPEADAVVFPQLVGEAYREIHHFKEINIPIVVITSEFGTVAMWDWEIVTFLKSEGLQPFAPYNLDLTKTICRTLGLKREMKQSKFLVFQDNPGDGMQASIFKRFFWWEDECVSRIQDKFGIGIVKKSFKQLAADAKSIADSEAEEVLKSWSIHTSGVTPRAFNSAVKMYIAVKREIENDRSIKGVGINCLNESAYSDTTPCLAWSMLYEELGVMWGCEGDILSLLNKYIIHKSIKAPVVMSNLYPFLMGDTAIKHERISHFPEVEEPENHILVGHCGFFACMPKSFASEWTLRPKVLGIVDENATAIDGRYPIGELTIAEMHPTLGKMLAVEGMLKDYVQYPGSDCRNGALLKVPSGHKLMSSLYSHHGILIPGHKKVELEFMSKVLNIGLEEV
ncbi:hypothetical protein [Paenibacillus radicis (ex Xue et al. 2023)]|uniref:Fucose isomerase n=1 Tax=Paenibacillus radicis (ex Xue et al. 2023) TaxID=2972489 RepID=A0ABT1YIQ6_9BACL|nr:hypothetical protein [Paenibacillus radicis (ex Xue et al. 2023)]MCR8633054.1 hypothetical protein [Paenibacillus radicis (ex Xue et al. 2023)]